MNLHQFVYFIPGNSTIGLISILCFFSIIFTTKDVHAGAANAELDCKSASGRTAVKASVPGDFADYQVTFTIDKASKSWDNSKDNNPKSSKTESELFVLGSMFDKNYHFVIIQKHEIRVIFKLSAIPTSIKVKSTKNGQRGTFKANVVGDDPRYQDHRISKLIEVDCSYAYEI